MVTKTQLQCFFKCIIFNVFGRDTCNRSNCESIKTIYQFSSAYTHLHIISDCISIAEIRPSSNFLLEHLRLYVIPNGENSVNISESQEAFKIVTSAFVNKELLTVKFFLFKLFLFDCLHLIGSKYT